MDRTRKLLGLVIVAGSMMLLTADVNAMTVALPVAMIAIYFWALSVEARGDLWRAESNNKRLKESVSQAREQEDQTASAFQDLVNDLMDAAIMMWEPSEGERDEDEIKREFLRTFCVLDPNGVYPQREMGHLFEQFVDGVGMDVSRRSMYKWMETCPDLPEYLYREDRTKGNHNVDWFGIRPKTPVELWQQNRHLREMERKRSRGIIGESQTELDF